MADIEITITIPDAKVQMVTDGFLRVYPNDTALGTKAWVRQYIIQNLKQIINAGLKQIDLEAQPVYVPLADDDEVVI